MSITVRTLLESDLTTADVILSSAFQRAESWKRELGLFQKLQPDGIFLAVQDGIPAGMVATIIYSEYAYIGLMGVHRDFQRKGVGMLLMQHVLAWTQQSGVKVLRLDASPFGQPLYEKLGFVPLRETYVLQKGQRDGKQTVPHNLRTMTPQDLDALAIIDQQAFGADRVRLLQVLLESFPGRAFIAQNEDGQIQSYIIAQEKRIGPWVVEQPAEAESLLLAALSLQYPGSVSVMVPAENAEAVALLQSHGFQIVRVNRHMAYGTDSAAGRRENIFGQTSLSMG